ncbi:MAG TPA: hypothetical protein P5511_07725, partial [Candidatus Goldiibacteriota bacterium]|nr:hypothetical protein [Candidatus Goldiibacteriota bacterium]
ASAAFTWMGHNTDAQYVSSGAGSMAVEVNMTNVTAAKRGDVSIDLSSAPADMSARTITAYIWTPAGIELLSPPYCFQAFLATSLQAAFSVNMTITASGWVKYEIPAPAASWSSSVEYVGIRMRKTNGTTTPDWSGRIYIDEVSW